MIDLHLFLGARLQNQASASSSSPPANASAAPSASSAPPAATTGAAGKAASSSESKSEDFGVDKSLVSIPAQDALTNEVPLMMHLPTFATVC